jgi:hypothetical protein
MVRLYGGFDGTEVAQEQRDFVNQVTVIDGHDSLAWLNQVYHVVYGEHDSRIDGFTITGGNATTSGEEAGGGILLNDFFMSSSSPELEIANCIITGNMAYWGGGMNAVDIESLVVTNTSFELNQAIDGGGLFMIDSNITFSDCVFKENTASDEGGGVYLWTWSNFDLYLDNLLFEGNNAYYGGALFSRLQFHAYTNNAIFTANTAEWGGGVYASDGVYHCTNCTFWSNEATSWEENGGAVYGDDSPDNGYFYSDNSIFWGNIPTSLDGAGGDWHFEINHCDIEGGFTGTGNIDADPLFVDTSNDDFHLSAGSPCIDAANGDLAPEFDIEGTARVDDPDTTNTGIGTPDYVDMGAFEFAP